MATSASGIPITMGALLVGGFFATILSGMVMLQTLWYFATYSKSDTRGLKCLVLSISVLDTVHTSFIWAALWECLIGRYGNSDIDYIPWNVSSTVILTAIVTFLVHCFFAFRILMLSRRNYLMAAPVIILAVLRLGAAAVSTWEMFHYKSYRLFQVHAFWIFTLGLSVSSVVDIIITGLLFYLFQATRPDAGHWHLNQILDKLTLYTFETGSLTCIGTIVAMICWVSMPNNLIFLGLHFVIGKLYATSLLVTLNTRENIRRARSISSGERQNPVLFLGTRRQNESGARYPGTSNKATELQINVETIASVHYDARESIETK